MEIQLYNAIDFAANALAKWLYISSIHHKAVVSDALYRYRPYVSSNNDTLTFSLSCIARITAILCGLKDVLSTFDGFI
jgi:hypothetical protein